MTELEGIQEITREDLTNPAGLKVRKCEVGKGVFAKRDFFENETLGLITGRIIDDPDHSSDYCIGLDGDLSLEPGRPFRFLNHSCEPNAELTYYDGDPASDIYVVAIQDIESGDEIVIDYAWPAESATPCFCQSRNCRGWIVTSEESHLVDRGE